jgi:hypothetical protein
MLWLERRVVAQLISPTVSPAERPAIEDYVGGALQAMPDHLRAGVALESIAFGALVRLEDKLGGPSPGRLDRHLERWNASRISVVRQYVRMFRSLVLFAENELVPECPQ